MQSLRKHGVRRAERLANRLALAGALMALVALSAPQWLPLLGRNLVVADPLATADAVLPLAGDEERIGYAVALQAGRHAPVLALTDMPVPPSSGSRYADWARGRAVALGAAEGQIVEVPGQGRTTYQEALNLRRFAEQRGWRRLIVVTSSYHTRRARMILRQVFAGSAVDVRVLPVPGSWYQPEQWWRSGPARKATALEYLKFAAHFAGVR